MRRLARYTLNVLTILSLLLCVATVGLWVRSYQGCESVLWITADSSKLKTLQCIWSSDHGRLRKDLLRDIYVVMLDFNERDHALRTVLSYKRDDSFSRVIHNEPVVPDANLDGRFGFYVSPEWNALYPSFNHLGSEWHLMFPHWAACAVVGLLPIARFARMYRSRTYPGLCSRCRYDLRATPERCPECGTIPAKT